MSPTDTRYLEELMTIYGTSRMGEGDPVAGANLLAAKACSLANIACPGSGLVTADGATISVGASLIVSGAHSAGLVSEKILSGQRTRQGNLVSNLRKKMCEIKEDAEMNPNFKASNNFAQEDMQKSKTDALSYPLAMTDRDAMAVLQSLVKTPAPTGFQDLIARHLVFITGDTATDLAGQFDRCHLGRPFIHLGVDGATDFARFEHQCPAVMDGRIHAAPMSEVIHGNVMVIDRSEALAEAVRTDMPRARWVSRMLWLMDGIAGPVAGNAGDGKTLVALDRVDQRYEAAMDKAWAQRINIRASSPEMLEFDFTQPQARWVAFLKKMEPGFPGIIGSARNLLATLLFGFFKINDIHCAPEGFRFWINHTEALSKFLVHRMVNARTVMRQTSENSRIRQLEDAIIHKLTEGPLCVRDITRRFHSLPVMQCRELLSGLEASGSVFHRDGRWQLVDPSIPITPNSRQLTLEA